MGGYDRRGLTRGARSGRVSVWRSCWAAAQGGSLRWFSAGCCWRRPARVPEGRVCTSRMLAVARCRVTASTHAEGWSLRLLPLLALAQSMWRSLPTAVAPMSSMATAGPCRSTTSALMGPWRQRPRPPSLPEATPGRMAISSDGHSAYVANSSDDSISQYDIGPGGLLAPKAQATVATGDTPEDVAISPDGTSAYVSNRLGNTLSQYDIGPGGLLAPKAPATAAAGTDPGRLALSPDGTSAYAVNLDTVSQTTSARAGSWRPSRPPPRPLATTLGTWRSPPTVKSAYVTIATSTRLPNTTSVQGPFHVWRQRARPPSPQASARTSWRSPPTAKARMSPT